MPSQGWQQLIPPADWFRAAGRYPIEAYSEFLPPPRLGWKPFADGPPDPRLFHGDDPWGWQVNEFEEARELQPGLAQLARQVVGRVRHLLRGERAHDGVPPRDLVDNPYWPPELASRAGSLGHDRVVVLAPLALTRSQDDKGRVQWALFGGSEQGPARPFWNGFRTGPGQEPSAEAVVGFLTGLLRRVFGEQVQTADDLKHVGLRILPQDGRAPLPLWDEGPLPDWAKPLRFQERHLTSGTRYLL